MAIATRPSRNWAITSRPAPCAAANTAPTMAARACLSSSGGRARSSRASPPRRSARWTCWPVSPPSPAANCRTMPRPTVSTCCPHCSANPAQGRPHIVEHATALSLIAGDWKVIQPHPGPKRNQTGNEIGNDPQPQLFNLASDLAEQNNVAAQNPDKVKELLAMLDANTKRRPLAAALKNKDSPAGHSRCQPSPTLRSPNISAASVPFLACSALSSASPRQVPLPSCVAPAPVERPNPTRQR